mmetsp:Transcript_124447/g.248220  ORF Transcript_124447/g.248220 Transcript_124447/m.248220 type:complete len:468 (+) Transcript_124447:30-1433(+)
MMTLPEGQDATGSHCNSTSCSSTSSRFQRPINGGTFPASDFEAYQPHKSSSSRPQRRRFPVLQHWRNEKVVWERQPGSKQPTIEAVEFAAHVQDFLGDIAGLGNKRQRRRGRLARCLPLGDGSDEVGFKHTESVLVNTVDGVPRGRVVDGIAGTEDGAGSSSCSAATDHRQQTSPPLKRVLWPEDFRGTDAAGSQQASAVSSTATVGSNSPLTEGRSPKRPPPLPPPRPALRRGSHDMARAQPKAALQNRSITFKEQVAMVDIKNFSGCAQELWYPGLVVECDKCDRDIVWMETGGPVGDPDKTRFANPQVLCDDCQANRVYCDIGAWYIVQLAASCEKPGTGAPSAAASDPILGLVDSLTTLSTTGSDQLVKILGREAECPEVRSLVIDKARKRLQYLCQEDGEIGGNATGEHLLDEGFGSEVEPNWAQAVELHESHRRLADLKAAAPLRKRPRLRQKKYSQLGAT